jgi:hypothetical protein
LADDTFIIDPGLLKWASETQKATLAAVNLHGGYRAAARVLGVNHSNLIRAMRALEHRAAAQGYAPGYDLTHAAAPGFLTKRVSTYYRATPDTPGQWHIQEPEKAAAFEAIREFIAALAEDVRGLSPRSPEPTHTNEDLLVVYPMGDPHFGMYAWKDEAGEDFDLAIAERITNAAMDGLVDTAPPAATAIILNLGDMFHADNESNLTARSGNVLDVDTRWQRVMQIGLRSMVYCIRRARQKHARVIVRINKGNHDTHSGFALALALDAYFANDPGVELDLSPAVHWYFQWGKVLIGSTHGDTTKMVDLPGVMTSDQRKAWGESDYCYWYCGHIHHDKVQEYPGVTVEYFRTLAPRDAWHAGQGYRAGRDMQCIIHHRRFGEIGRHRRGIAMIEPREAA